MNGEIDHTGAEPAGGEADYTLADLVQDPLIRLVMKSDGVDRQSIERLFARIAGERPRAARQRAAAAAGRRLWLTGARPVDASRISPKPASI